MRVMILANLLVGDAGVLDMTPEKLEEWQADKVRALAAALGDARARGAERCVVAGGLLAEGFVPQSLLGGAVDALGSCGMPVTWLPLEREAADLDLRTELPANVTMVRGGGKPLAGVGVTHDGSEVELLLNGSDGPSVQLPDPLEPLGFGEQARSGYLLVDVEDGVVVNSGRVSRALHPFVTRVLDMTGKTTSREMVAALRSAVQGIDGSACLRLVLRGSMPLATYVSTEGLADVLAKTFFYSEVSNECGVAISDDELETDVSLMAEFARLVEADDSLSTIEKTRVMRCGWNALNGKELAE